MYLNIHTPACGLQRRITCNSTQTLAGLDLICKFGYLELINKVD